MPWTQSTDLRLVFVSNEAPDLVNREAFRRAVGGFDCLSKFVNFIWCSHGGAISDVSVIVNKVKRAAFSPCIGHSPLLYTFLSWRSKLRGLDTIGKPNILTHAGQTSPQGKDLSWTQHNQDLVIWWQLFYACTRAIKTAAHDRHVGWHCHNVRLGNQCQQNVWARSVH